MVVKLSGQQTERWEKVDLGAAGDFEIQMRRPTYEDYARHLAIGVESINGADGAELRQIECRMQSAFCDWRGIEDSESKPVPFSWDSLKALCSTYRSAFVKLSSLSVEAFSGMDEDASKNSDVSPIVASDMATPKT